jgi:DNA-binding NarL/FixJ family response regulator
MDEEKREHLGPSTSVAIVAPVWLQNALLVFLHSSPSLKLVACTATVQVLLALDLEQTPQIIIIETDKRRDHAQDQIKWIKAAWPASSIIALIPHSNLRALMRAAGADEVLVSGSEPEQLRQAISHLKYLPKDSPSDPLELNEH